LSQTESHYKEHKGTEMLIHNASHGES